MKASCLALLALALCAASADAQFHRIGAGRHVGVGHGVRLHAGLHAGALLAPGFGGLYGGIASAPLYSAGCGVVPPLSAPLASYGASYGASGTCATPPSLSVIERTTIPAPIVERTIVERTIQPPPVVERMVYSAPAYSAPAYATGSCGSALAAPMYATGGCGGVPPLAAPFRSVGYGAAFAPAFAPAYGVGVGFRSPLFTPRFGVGIGHGAFFAPRAVGFGGVHVGVGRFGVHVGF